MSTETNTRQPSQSNVRDSTLLIPSVCATKIMLQSVLCTRQKNTRIKILHQIQNFNKVFFLFFLETHPQNREICWNCIKLSGDKQTYPFKLVWKMGRQEEQMCSLRCPDPLHVSVNKQIDPTSKHLLNIHFFSNLIKETSGGKNLNCSGTMATIWR